MSLPHYCIITNKNLKIPTIFQYPPNYILTEVTQVVSYQTDRQNSKILSPRTTDIYLKEIIHKNKTKT